MTYSAFMIIIFCHSKIEIFITMRALLNHATVQSRASIIVFLQGKRTRLDLAVECPEVFANLLQFYSY